MNDKSTYIVESKRTALRDGSEVNLTFSYGDYTEAFNEYRKTIEMDVRFSTIVPSAINVTLTRIFIDNTKQVLQTFQSTTSKW
jgi:hypothetical protein